MAGSRFWVEIVCQDCAKTHPGSGRFVYGSSIPVREMNSAARKDGWAVLGNGEHLCPRCLKAIAGEATNQPENPA